MVKCIGCGHCCKVVTCAAGQFYYHISKYEKCPGLIFKNGRYWCELLLKKIKIPFLLRTEIDITTGCCYSRIKGGIAMRDYRQLKKNEKLSGNKESI